MKWMNLIKHLFSPTLTRDEGFSVLDWNHFAAEYHSTDFSFVLTDLIIILCEKADSLAPYFCGRINRNRRSKELRPGDNGHLKPQTPCHPVCAGGERVHFQVKQSRISFQLLWHYPRYLTLEVIPIGIQNIFNYFPPDGSNNNSFNQFVLKYLN